MTDELDASDLALLRAAGLRPTRSCADCRCGWIGDNGRAHCGASPDWSPPPYWARKYTVKGLLHLLADRPLPNTNCEDLDPNIAEECEAYGEKERDQTTAKHREGVAR